jgi:hypothetical protein
VLAGVEAGMLTTKRFGALSTDQIQMHQDKSWSKVSGWWAIGRRMVSRQPGDGPVLSPVWIPLFVLSILSWAFARQPRLPLLGAVYSTPGAPTAASFNMTTGNELPPDTQLPLFLAAQAEVPVTGTAWGMALRYGCRPIYKLDDFKILSKRLNSKTPGYLNGTARGPGSYRLMFNPAPPDHYFYDVPGLPNATISVMSTIGRLFTTIAEVGISSGIYNTIDLATRGYVADPGGLDTDEVLELALWQADGLSGARQETDTIPELEGEYLIYPSDSDETYPPKYPMTAIGIQCSSASSTGWARLNGLAGTFNDFRRGDPEYPGDLYIISFLPRFSLAVPAMLLSGIRWHKDFFVTELGAKTRPDFPSVKDFAPWLPPDTFDYKYVENVDKFGNPDFTGAIYTTGQVPGYEIVWQGANYSQFASPEHLQRALESAYKHAAVTMLYTGREMPYQAWTSLNLTAAVPWTTLGAPREAVPVLLVLVLLSLWALGCMVLGLAYSFRKRWDAFFTTRSLYWYCRKTVGVDPMEVMKKTN